MKRIIFAIVIILNTTLAYCDEIRIPFNCYPKEIQADFAERGLKLDLSGNDRTPESWGFLENKGSSFSIFTYKPIIEKEFELITEIINKGGAYK